MRSLLIPLTFGLVAAMVMADPLGFHSTNNFGDIKSPVGKCPSKDGEYPTYLPDSTNCSTFYECSGGEPFPKDCLPGLCFDPVLNVCSFPDAAPLAAVGTCPPRDGNATIYLTDDKNCSIYYICSNGNAIEAGCTTDMVWNPKLNICDYEVDVGCNLSKEPVDPSIIIEMSEPLPYNPVGTCPPRDGNATIYLTDDKNCTIYYICSNGNAIQATCTPGMVWNSKLNICDWEVDVGCNLRHSQAADAEFYSVVGTCPDKDPAIPIFLPDSQSCKVYYECSGGVPIENYCPDDLEFNPVLMVCDYYLDAGCKASNSTSSD